MSEFFKNTRKFSLVLGALLLAVTLATGSIAYVLEGASITPKKPSQSESSQEPIEEAEDTLPASTQTDTAEEVDDGPVVYNTPAEMRGVFLTPGVDFLKTKDTSEALLQSDIDKALENAKKLTMNTVIIDTVYNDQVIFQTKDAPELSNEFDIMDYIVKSARAQEMYTYAIFDASLFESKSSAVSLLAVGAGTVNKLSANVGEFAEKYGLDGILLDGYTNKQAEQSYSSYLNIGGAIGYDNFMRQTPAAIVKTAAKSVRKASPATQVGLLADPVWANKTDNDEGSATKAAFTALGSGNADTKSFVEKGIVDFVAVKAYASLTDTAEPFEEVVTWWGTLARENDVPMYVVHAANKICTDEAGWQSQDQLARQVIQASSVSGFNGSIFNNLQRLVEDPKQATTTLVKYYNQEITPEYILTELVMTKPEKTTYTTFEPSVTFTGASDPNAPVTINGEEIKTDASGYFTVTQELMAGENKFTIKHKEKTINYAITRQVQVLKEASPMGSVTTEGSMSLTITALAYPDAEVVATINGTTVPLSDEDSIESEADRDSSFRLFTGEYTVPAATTSVQNLGSIVVTATWQGQKESITAANVKVNKRAKIEDGVPVVVIADQARTYPPNTLNNIPTAGYYPIPKGAHDYAVGDEIVYKSDKNITYTYYVLASGLRVETKDLQPSGEDDYVSNNAVSGMSVSSEGGFTFVTLKTAQKVSYAFKYNTSSVEIKLNNTVQVPSGMSLSKNPLFTEAKWSGGNTLTLTLTKAGGFMGYKGYYDSDGNLVFKFNNPPSSLSGARITVDPGHGGKDTGALGFLADYPEKVINRAIAELLADELTSRGATVKLLDTTEGSDTDERVRARVQQAEQFNSDLMVSIHCNSAPNASAAGTEVYYFYPYARTLATNAAKSVSGQLSTNNRGPKASYYHVTLSSQVPSVLVETGFMSNKAEYEKLIKQSYQQKIATGVADALSSTIKAIYTGTDSTGSESTGAAASTNTSSSTSGGGGPVEDISLSDDSITIGVDKSYTIKAEVYPEDADDATVTWKSSASSYVSVSSSGKVTGLKVGSATITATTVDGKLKATCSVKVTEDGGGDDSGSDDSSSGSKATTTGVSINDCEDIHFDNDYLTIYPGSSQQLVVLSEEDETVRNSDIVWKSSASSIATVDVNGNVKAVKVGVADITATSKTDSKLYITASINVSRTKVKVTDISLDEDSITVVKGKTAKIKATVTPSNATTSDLVWSSVNERIATVDSNGTIKGINVGSTTIKVRAKEGSYSTTCKVEVTRTAIEIDYIEIYPETLDMWVGDKDQLTADVYPDDATDKTVTWTSSNTSVVTVDSKGNIKAIKKGSATITAAIGSTKATCKITVSN